MKTTLFAKQTFLSPLLLMFIFCGAQAQEQQTLWIDVRSTSEHKQGHIAGHHHIPHRQLATQIAAVTTDLNASISLYCAAGVRAQAGKETLESIGYTNVTNVGGIEDARQQLKN